MFCATYPWINALYATPIIGLAPLFVIIFGFGLYAKIAVVIALAIFPILINTVSGACARSPGTSGNWRPSTAPSGWRRSGGSSCPARCRSS
jgi:hypothetical protein